MICEAICFYSVASAFSILGWERESLAQSEEKIVMLKLQLGEFCVLLGKNFRVIEVV